MTIVDSEAASSSPVSEGRSVQSLSVAPSTRWFVMLVGIVAAVFLPPPIFADMTTSDRLIFVALTAAFVLMALAASRNRLTVHGVMLIQRVVLRSTTFRLDRLAGVRVFRVAGPYNRPWQMTLTDSAGGQMHLRLNGYAADDRKRLMAALAPFVRRTLRAHIT